MNVPIITYHALGDINSPLWISTQVFEKHLKFFADNGFQTISLSSLKAYLSHYASLPDKAFVITFDDGYESVYTEALPRLKEYGFKATVFLISNYCSLSNQWPSQPDSVPESSLLSWKQIYELTEEGCEIGAHTQTHPFLPSLSYENMYNEIVLSKLRIEEQVGHPIRHFAYPYGAKNHEVIKVAQQYFETAVSTKLGLVKSSDDLHSLNRIDAYYLSSWGINNMNTTFHESYLSLRQVIRELRSLIAL